MSRKYSLHMGAGPAPAGIDFSAELNDQQLAAVTHPGGPALVIAGAGSGKTRTLTYRVAWLLSKGIPANSILLLTFTNKAAREMLDRVADLVPEKSRGIWGGTFHSIGNRILRAHAERIAFMGGFSIMDREDSEDLISGVLAREGLVTTDRKFPKAGVLADIFSLSANTGKSIRQLLGERYRYFIPLSEQIERAHVAYELRKRETNVMDFDDLLTKTLALFAEAPDVGDAYRRQFLHVLVDEYQDTNVVQAGLARALSGGTGNLTVVGDDAQSIYSWRGAHFANILDFPKQHPDAVVFKIETNYRSVPEVLDVANAAIRANERQFPKTLAPARKSHPVKPALVALGTNNAQATFVAQRILELEQEGIALDDMAVLYRAHFHSMEIQLEFTRRGIPFGITSGLRFFEQAHIKDVAAFMKLAVNPRDEVAFKRAIRLLPGVGAKFAESLWVKTSQSLIDRNFEALHEVTVPAKASRSWTQFVHTLAELSPSGTPAAPSAMINSVMLALYDDLMQEKFANYDARKEDIATLAGYAGQFESAEDFLSQLTLLAGAEAADAVAPDQDSGKVTLSTIHQAKGLEWKVVFLVWLTEGMFPHSRSSESEEELEEERRLFYVGVTRCCDELYLTFPEMRLNAGYGEAFQRPSRFLSEIPESLLEAWDVEIDSGGDSPF